MTGGKNERVLLIIFFSFFPDESKEIILKLEKIRDGGRADIPL